MNGNWWKYGLFLVGGVAAGALGAVAASRGNVNLRPFARDLIEGGLNIKDKAAAMVGGAKEQWEDLVAEAAEARENKKLKKAREAEEAAPEA